MAKKDFDLDAEIEKIARKSNINIQKTEFAFENQIRKLDKDIDKSINKKIKSFDKDKELLSDYLTIENNHDTVERYREKLKKI